MSFGLVLSRRFSLLGLTLAFLLAVVSLAQAEERVLVRGGEHDGFGRLVFDWEKRVEYEARIENGYLEVRFDRPVAFDLSPLKRDLEDYLAGAQVSEDRRSVIFPLKGGFGLKHFRLDEKVVVDLKDGGPGAGAAQATEIGAAPVQAPPAEPKAAPRMTTAGKLADSNVTADAPADAESPAKTQKARLQDTGDKPAGPAREIAAPPVPPSSLHQWEPPARRERGPAKEAAQSPAPAQTSAPVQANAPAETQPAAEEEPAASEPESLAALPPLEPRKEPARPESEAEEKAAGESEGEGPTELLPLAFRAPLARDRNPLDAPEAMTPAAGDEAAETPAETPAPEDLPELADAAQGMDETPREEPARQEDSGEAETAEQGSADQGPARAVEEAITLSLLDKPEETEGDEAAAEEVPIGEDGEPLPMGDSGGQATAESAAEEEPAETATGKTVPMTGPIGQKEKPVALRFNWAKPTAAAVFRRGDRIWLVFDRPTKPGLAERIAGVAPELQPSALESESGTIIRLTASHRLSPLLKPEDNAWILDLRVREEKPASALSLVLDGKSEPPKAMIPLRQPGRLQAFVDPDLGDLLYVTPLQAADSGFERAHEFPEFRILESRQGVVVKPKSEDLKVELEGNTLVLTSEPGLLLSSATPKDVVDTTSRLTPARHLFDLEAWRKGGKQAFSQNRQKLQAAVLEADRESRGLARLNLARFFFAHGFATEALGVLALLEDDDPRLARDPQAVLMRGAANVMIGKFEEAEKALSDAALTGELEADLWRAALAASSQDWGYAASAFERSAVLAEDYPAMMRSRLLLLAAEAAIETKDAPAASLFLTQLRDGHADSATRARVEFLEGRRLLLEEDRTAARRHLNDAAASSDREAEARARLQLIDLDLEAGEITRAEAIEALEQLRAGWRGDAFEFAVLNRIGNLHVAEGQFRDALLSFKQAVSHLPDSPGAEKMAERMGNVFRDIFIGDYAGEMGALESLALYEEFRELTPSGKEGDAVIRDLAERLAQVDLLDEAARLLRRQVEFRLKGEEAAEVGARIAELELMNRQPDAALEALAMSRSEEPIAVSLIRERRLLRARALSEAGEHEQALATIAEDEDEEARRLRVAIRWDQQDWPGLALALEAMVPEELPGDAPPDPETGKLIAALAIAYSMADDRAGLADIGWRFGDAMAQSPEKSTFEMLVTDLDKGMITSIEDELKGVALIQDFLKDYQDRRAADAPNLAQADPAEGEALEPDTAQAN